VAWLNAWALITGEKVNRVDPCTDLAVSLPRLDLSRDVVTRARKKVNYLQVEHYTHGRRDTGYRFGGRPVMARIYDKGYELTKSEKVWFHDVWRHGGWDGKSEVTRFEFQIGRPSLLEYRVDSYTDLTLLLPDIWRGMTTKYLALKEANSLDSNHRRWKTSALWSTVQSAGAHFGECLGVERWKQKHAKLEPMTLMLKGTIASIVALDSQIRGEHFAVLRLRSEITAFMESEEFHAKVLEKRGKYGSMSN
jgi:hypothetical protein